MLRILRQLCDDRRGVTAIEYAILTCLIALTLIFSLSDIGASLAQTFTSIDTKIQVASANSGGSGGGGDHHHDHDGH